MQRRGMVQVKPDPGRCDRPPDDHQGPAEHPASKDGAVSHSNTQHSQDTDGRPMSRDENYVDATESLSLDCSAEPTEVIVSGNNVKSIRLKFPPRPPSGETRNVTAAPGRTRMKPTEHADDTEYKADLPSLQTAMEHSSSSYPTEHGIKSLGKSNSLPSGSKNVDNPLKGLSRSSSQGAMPSQEVSSRKSESATRRTIDYGIYDILEIGSDAVFKDGDNKMKNDFLNILDRFEKQRKEMRSFNRRIMQELQKVISCNKELEERIWKLEEVNKSLTDENTEYRITLDKYESEKKIFDEQSVNQWKEKVALEEKYVEVKHIKQKEVAELQKSLALKDVEIKQLKQALNDTKKNGSSQNDSKERELQYLHEISRLKEELRTTVGDRDLEKRQRSQLAVEMSALRQQMAVQQGELEKQVHRFLSLKKSFNELHIEKEKLKCVSRSRQNSLDGGANSTWPATGKGAAKREAVNIDAKPPMGLADHKRASVLPVPGNGRNVVAKGNKPGTLTNISMPVVDGRKSTETLPPV